MLAWWWWNCLERFFVPRLLDINKWRRADHQNNKDASSERYLFLSFQLSRFLRGKEKKTWAGLSPIIGAHVGPPGRGPAPKLECAYLTFSTDQQFSYSWRSCSTACQKVDVLLYYSGFTKKAPISTQAFSYCCHPNCQFLGYFSPFTATQTNTSLWITRTQKRFFLWPRY